MELNEPKVVAFIDLGTNSARLLVVKLNSNHSYTILTQQKEVVRLGEGEFADNLLTVEAIERTVVVISRLAEIARAFSADDFIAVATSATRDARNRDVLISRIKGEAGIEMNIISGPEEARLIWLGVSSGVDIGEKSALFIDIGGGSTEVIVGDQTRTFLLRSLKLGAIRLTNMFMPDFCGQIPDSTIQRIRRHIRSRASHTIRHVKGYPIQQVFGSSGTISTLELIAASMKGQSDPHRPGLITRAELSVVVRHLSSLSLKDRRAVPGLNPDRADIIVAGAIILESLLDLAGVSEIQVSSRSLRDGLLVDYLSRIPGFPHAEPMSVRETSIRQLGRSCHIDESHAGHVEYLARSLFDTARISGYHALSDEDREILSHAAYLHDVGQFIAFSGHHQHSFYLIIHAPLLGFHEYEILMIALVARYHRKKMPRQKDSGYTCLDPEDRVIIQLLALFLRMAENLDRSHDGRIMSASLSPGNRGETILTIGCRSDCTLEQWAIIGDVRAFERTFKKKLTVAVSPQIR
ncbi:MAG: Ppx/GppA phosphatase family protein [Methanobacteriota archaeon]